MTSGKSSSESARYRTIVVDPPWEYPDGFVSFPGQRTGRNAHGKSGGNTRVAKPLPYAPMSLEEIRALPIGGIAARDAFLFLWTTNRHLPAAFELVTAWGFVYRQTLIWRKTGSPSPFGGTMAPNHAEYLLVAGRGSPRLTGRLGSNVMDAPAMSGERRQGHSRKPECFIDAIEEVSPEPRLEMFARRARLIGWDYWGDQSLGTAELPERAA